MKREEGEGGEGAETSNFISFSLCVSVRVRVCVRVFVVVVVVVVVLFVKKCPLLPCFINFSFNSFVISYWMYFIVIERNKI